MKRQQSRAGGLDEGGAPDVVDHALKGIRLVGNEGGVAEEGGVRVAQQQAMPQLDCIVLHKNTALHNAAHLCPGC